MYREELRVIEYSKSNSEEKKKSKKKEVQLGLFHLWGKEEDKKGKENFFALVEDVETGNIIEVASKNIRFLSDDEIAEITDQIDDILGLEELSVDSDVNDESETESDVKPD